MSTKISIEVDLVEASGMAPSDFADKLQEFLFIVFDDESTWPEVDVFYGTDVLR
jgi:hypothetical protein